MTQYDVGGVLFPRPFRIRRLGHFGFNLESVARGVDFYGRLLGFRVSDDVRFGEVFGRRPPHLLDERMVFMTHNTDHHAMLLAHRTLGGPDPSEITLSQITWQVGSLQEVVNAVDYFDRQGVKIKRSGRDMPGSNWHVYAFDPDGHTVELYYGMEQIGLGGRSKPRPMYDRRFADRPPLPQIGDIDELARAQARGTDVESGHRLGDLGGDERHDVEGVLLPRPFKITSIGPMGLFVADVDASVAFYRDALGFMVTEEVLWRGQRCVFLRHGREHHSLKLYPKALRAELGLSAHTSCASMGLQVGSYAQLRAAVDWLAAQGACFVELPHALNPGIDYCAHVLDPEGHCLQLYYYMEQLGWDGRPRPAALRREPVRPWPQTLVALEDTYADQVFMGPLG